MRTIEVGAVRIHLEENEEAVALLQSLLRPLSNKEVAAMIGISERTVMRWKRCGRLPSREQGQIFVLDLLRHLAPERRPDG
jgi:FixJ family two-component response regulator